MNNVSFIVILVVCVVIIAVFIRGGYFLAKKPFIPYKLIQRPTVVASGALCILNLFHDTVFTTFLNSQVPLSDGTLLRGPLNRIESLAAPNFQVDANSPSSNALRVFFSIVSRINLEGRREDMDIERRLQDNIQPKMPEQSSPTGFTCHGSPSPHYIHRDRSQKILTFRTFNLFH
jgi:hypothetical protein